MQLNHWASQKTQLFNTYSIPPQVFQFFFNTQFPSISHRETSRFTVKSASRGLHQGRETGPQGFGSGEEGGLSRKWMRFTNGGDCYRSTWGCVPLLHERIAENWIRQVTSRLVRHAGDKVVG
jgi:hypothetical protein